MKDEKHWANPEEFIPERFIDSDGKYLSTRPQAFIPFSIGRRECVGQKLAIADLFFVLVRFLQMTAEFDVVLDSHQGLEADNNYANAIVPFEYKIMFKTKTIN